MLLFLFNLFLLISPPERSFPISEIHISGNEVTQDFIILREIPIQPGDLVSKSRLDYYKDRIYSLGLFTRVDYQLDSLKTGFRLKFTVHERWFWLVYPTINFKTQDRAKPWDVSEWNDLTYGFRAFHNNILGRQISMMISGQNGYSQGLGIRFSDPNIFLNTNILVWTGLNYSKGAAKNKFEDSNPDAANDENFGVNLGAGYRFNPYTIFAATWNYRMISVPGVLSDSSLDVLLNNKKRKDLISGLITSFSIDARNSIEFATEGFFSNTELRLNRESGTGQFYGGLRLDKRAYLQLSDWVTFAGLISYETGLGSFIPFYEHLLTGRDEYLRGYQSTILESTKRWVFRSELRHQVFEPRVTELSWIPVKQFKDFRWGLYALAFSDVGYLNKPHKKYAGLNNYIRTQNLGSYYDRFLYSGGFALNLLLPYSLVLKGELAFIPNGKPTFWIMTGRAF
ncbi:MAG: BamA/TamA family outer membrane protein [Bacteroidetes bacterium]|nr:BamA/TamA family outer membrane protein [Bacteroidota bacterium]